MIASFASIVFYDPIYLAAVVWAIAGIASKEEYRIERLGKPVADGVTEGLTALWIALVCVGVVGIIVFVVRRSMKKHEQLPDRHRATGGTSDDGHTRAIFSS